MIELIKGNVLNKQDHFYHTKEWTDFIEKSYNIDIYTLNIKVKQRTGSNNMQILLPIKSNRVILPPLWAYNLPVLEKDPKISQQIEFSKELYNYLKDRFSYFHINWPIDHHTYELQKYSGIYYEFILNLPPKIPNPLKRKINKIKSPNIKTHERLDKNIANTYYNILSSSYKKRNKKIPFSFKTFLNITQLDNIIIHEIEANDSSSLSIVGIFYNKAYHLISVGTNSDIMMYYVFEDLNKKGIIEFYMAGANTPGIIEYKMKFNPRIYPIARIEKIDTITQIKKIIKDKLCL